MIRRQRTSPNTNSRTSRRLQRSAGDVLPSTVFREELDKEIKRSNSRSKDRDFGLIRLRFHSLAAEGFPETESFGQCVARLRVSDLVGWYDSTVSFLLPECDRDGVLLVANEMNRICVESGISVDAEVSIYPMDDELISLADELQPGYDPNHQSAEENETETLEGEIGDESFGQGFSNAELTEGDDLEVGHGGGVLERVDKAHDSQQGSVHRHGRSGAVTLTEERDVANPVEPFSSPQGRVRLTRHRFIPSKPTPWWKRGIDILGAGIGLLLLSPIFLIAALAIKSSSKGPVFFRQMREGKDGIHFGILKFRTMVVDAEELQEALRVHSEQDGPAFKLKDDPRVTGVGRYLRKSCVDELPQLINVLLGHMSLVGPRPLPVSESLACTAWQRVRLTVLPGLTCTWQVHGGRDVKFAEWMRMDLDYIDRQSFLLDLRLIIETAFIALLHRGSV